MFTTPEIGTVGLSETAARERVSEIDIYKARFRPMRNTLAGRDERMLMKLVVDAETDRRARLPRAGTRRDRDRADGGHRHAHGRQEG